MKYLSILILSTLFLLSCNTITNPTVERIENVQIEELSTKAVKGTANMVILNPNPFALDLAGADLLAIVDDIELAHIKQVYDTSMPANTEFQMPIRLEMDLQKLYENDPLGALGKGMQIYSKRELTVHFKGTIKVGKGAAKISVPVDQKELVKF